MLAVDPAAPPGSMRTTLTLTLSPENPLTLTLSPEP